MKTLEDDLSKMLYQAIEGLKSSMSSCRDYNSQQTICRSHGSRAAKILRYEGSMGAVLTQEKYVSTLFHFSTDNIQEMDFGTLWNDRMDALGAKRGTWEDFND